MDELVLNVKQAVAVAMPKVISELTELVAIPSVSWESFDQSHILKSAQAVSELLRSTELFESVDIVSAQRSVDGLTGNPAVLASRTAKLGMPTILLYAHHDVQPPGDETMWNTSPFECVRVGDRLYGRGAADDKAGIISHVQSLRMLHSLANSVDLGIVVFIEGEEEAGSPSFTNFLEDNKEQLASDVIIVADSGNFTESIPALTATLRGNVTLNVTISTLDHAVHSGMFGGAVPDAFMILSRLVNSFYDSNGSVSIQGLLSHPDKTPQYDINQLREESGLLESVTPIGTGDFLNRIWSQPSIVVTGADLPDVAHASNTLLPSIRARISLRVSPGQPAAEAAEALIVHINKNIEFGAHVEISDLAMGEGFAADMTGSAAQLMCTSLRDAWGESPVNIGVGGSIPFISEFVSTFPHAQVLVTGVEDPDSRAHSPNESLHLGSFEKYIAGQSLYLLRLNEGQSVIGNIQ